MANYKNIYIGFIDDSSTIVKRDKKCTDNVLLSHIYTFIHDYCIIQYDIIKKDHNCRLCNITYTNKKHVFYDGYTRYIFPDYLYHYIKNHDIEIDDRLICLLKTIFNLDYL